MTKSQLQKKLAEVMVTPTAHEQIIAQASTVIAQALANSGQSQPESLTEKLPTIVSEALPYDEILAVSAKVYGDRFNEQELAALIAFYQTDAGSKLLKEQAAITQDMSERVSQIVSQRWPNLMRKHSMAP